MNDFQQAMVALDMALTLHSRRDAEHTARGQADSIEHWMFDHHRIWYLSDGGYSRVVMSEFEPHIWLTSNSTDRVKARWEQVGAEIAVVEGMLKDYFGQLLKGVPRERAED